VTKQELVEHVSQAIEVTAGGHDDSVAVVSGCPEEGRHFAQFLPGCRHGQFPALPLEELGAHLWVVKPVLAVYEAECVGVKGRREILAAGLGIFAENFPQAWVHL